MVGIIPTALAPVAAAKAAATATKGDRAKGPSVSPPWAGTNGTKMSRVSVSPGAPPVKAHGAPAPKPIPAGQAHAAAHAAPEANKYVVGNHSLSSPVREMFLTLEGTSAYGKTIADDPKEQRDYATRTLNTLNKSSDISDAAKFSRANKDKGTVAAATHTTVAAAFKEAAPTLGKKFPGDAQVKDAIKLMAGPAGHHPSAAPSGAARR